MPYCTYCFSSDAPLKCTDINCDSPLCEIDAKNYRGLCSTHYPQVGSPKLIGWDELGPNPFLAA